MDNSNINNLDIDHLVSFITDEISIAIPLYISNPNKSIRVHLDSLDDAHAAYMVKAVLDAVFTGNHIWICDLGKKTINSMFNHGFFMNLQQQSVTIPFNLNATVDTDWFEYDENAIACVYADFCSFNCDSYITHVLSREFLSNTILLINCDYSVAVHVYDRRGMDIVATNPYIVSVISNMAHSVHQKSVGDDYPSPTT